MHDRLVNTPRLTMLMLTTLELSRRSIRSHTEHKVDTPQTQTRPTVPSAFTCCRLEQAPVLCERQGCFVHNNQVYTGGVQVQRPSL